jgi:hypothetical protein
MGRKKDGAEKRFAMTRLGSNVKITAPRSAQSKLRTLFEALGAMRQSPNANTDVFVGGAGTVGFVYVDDVEALTVAEMRIAPWIELAVDDPARSAESCAALGLERLDITACRDGDHAYFVAPGGLVFRLADALSLERK